MKKHVVTIIGANVDNKFKDKVIKFFNDQDKNVLVLAPKTGFGQNVEVKIQEIEVEDKKKTLLNWIFG